MRVKTTAIYWLVILLPLWLAGQTKISGIITDGKEPLAGVNVVVFKTNSSYLTATISDSIGKYKLQAVQTDSCRIRFSLVGYIEKTIAIKLDSKTLQIPNVIMEAEAFQMDAVTVIAKRAAFKIEPGKTTVDLSAASLGSDGSVLNSLGKIPGILILNDGTVLLNGQAGANVMIDDKLTYLSGDNLLNLLRSIPSNAVDKIEMVTQPAAKYDAAGAVGFINIQRKKKGNTGLNVILSSNAELGRLFRQNQSVSLRLQKNKYILFADYSFYNRRDFMMVNSFRNYFNNTTSEPTGVKLDMQADRKFDLFSHYFKVGTEYEFSEKLTVGVNVRANWFDRGKKETAISDFFQNSFISNSSILTRNNQQANHNNLEVGSNFLYKFSPNFKWENAFNILTFEQKESLDQKNWKDKIEESSSANTLQGMMKGTIQIVNFQSDIDTKIANKFTFQSGIKTSFITIDNNALYNTLLLEQWVENEKLSSSFHYKEKILAGYIQSDQKWSSRFSTKLGLRMEHTSTEARYLVGPKDSIFSRPYNQLFPSLSLNYKLTDEQTVSLQYGRRIVRPNYRDLNPFTEVVDHYLLERGNTGLNPELINNLETSWIIKSRYVFSLFYTVRKNPITKSYLTEPDSEATIVMPLNLKQSYNVGFRSSINGIKPAIWWNTQFNASLTYKQFHWLEAEKIYSNNLLSPTAQVTNQFTLPRQWTIEATGYFNGTMAEGQAKIGSFGSVSLGTRKKFFENKLNMYIYINDIFLSSNQQISLRNSIISGQYKERRDTRMAGITLIWQFNSGKLSKTIRKEENTEESKRINL